MVRRPRGRGPGVAACGTSRLGTRLHRHGHSSLRGQGHQGSRAKPGNELIRSPRRVRRSRSPKCSYTRAVSRREARDRFRDKSGGRRLAMTSDRRPLRRQRARLHACSPMGECDRASDGRLLGGRFVRTTAALDWRHVATGADYDQPRRHARASDCARNACSGCGRAGSPCCRSQRLGNPCGLSLPRGRRHQGVP
jgi:hypothetical protein